MIVLLVATLALPVALAGCGGGDGGASTTSATGTTVAAKCTTVRFAKTKLALHSGLAAGAFYQFVYKPYRAGAFASGAEGRTKAFVKAGAAALFALNEARLALCAARSSPGLAKVVAPLAGLQVALTELVDGLKDNGLDPDLLETILGGFGGVTDLAGRGGVDVERLRVPGLS